MDNYRHEVLAEPVTLLPAPVPLLHGDHTKCFLYRRGTLSRIVAYLCPLTFYVISNLVFLETNAFDALRDYSKCCN